MSSLLKDIKAERPKVTEKDNLRLLYLTKWFLEFFQLLRAGDKHRVWEYGLVAEVIERSWIAWVLKRIREAGEEKVIAPSVEHTYLFTNIPLSSAQTLDGATSRYRVPDPTRHSCRCHGQYRLGL